MFFSFFKKRRRRKLLAEPFPEAWLDILQTNVGLYALLPPNLQEKLRDTLRIFIAEKDWEGCRGLEMTDEVKVTVAALASILLLGQEGFYFDNVQTILVYPAGYKARRRQGLGGGVYIESTNALLGEANHYTGPITLSWNQILLAAREPGHGENLVFHEFAHKIDMLTGYVDGTPPMPAELLERWEPVMRREYRRLVHAAEWGRKSFLDPYGATDEAEFFAVTTEAFFDDPLGLRADHPALYRLFSELYAVDPAAWFGGGDTDGEEG